MNSMTFWMRSLAPRLFNNTGNYARHALGNNSSSGTCHNFSSVSSIQSWHCKPTSSGFTGNQSSSGSLFQRLSEAFQPGVPSQSVRTVYRCHYRPNAMKRMRKHGLKKRTSSVNGLQVLWRRILKGRHNMSTHDHLKQ